MSPNAEAPDRAALAGLAQEVDALRRHVEKLGTLRREVIELGGLVARLSDAVAVISSDQPQAPPAPSWLAFPSDPDGPAAAAADARQLLTALAEWLGEVYLRYDDAYGRFPDCWLWHPNVVEELLWLHSAWLAAYAPGAPRTAVGDWHDRLRPMVARRIRDRAGACSLEAHVPRGMYHKPAPVAPHSEAIDAIADWWTTRRTEPGPTPTEDQLTRPNHGPRNQRRDAQ